MSIKNDEMILKLKQQIEKRKEKLLKITKVFTAKTSCMFITDYGTKHNLRVMNTKQLNELKVKLHMYEISAKDLGIDINDFSISGFTIEQWMHDIDCRLSEIEYRNMYDDLKKDEDLLDSLLSEDKKTELLLQEILEKFKNEEE